MSKKKSKNGNSILIPSTSVSGRVGNLVIQKNGYIRIHVVQHKRKRSD
jgi:hypothetical protein